MSDAIASIARVYTMLAPTLPAPITVIFLPILDNTSLSDFRLLFMITEILSVYACENQFL
jgi:hypothetical protein